MMLDASPRRVYARRAKKARDDDGTVAETRATGEEKTYGR
jgi:hypothetical protein